MKLEFNVKRVSTNQQYDRNSPAQISGLLKKHTAINCLRCILISSALEYLTLIGCCFENFCQIARFLSLSITTHIESPDCIVKLGFMSLTPLNGVEFATLPAKHKD